MNTIRLCSMRNRKRNSKNSMHRHSIKFQKAIFENCSEINWMCHPTNCWKYIFHFVRIFSQIHFEIDVSVANEIIFEIRSISWGGLTFHTFILSSTNNPTHRNTFSQTNFSWYYNWQLFCHWKRKKKTFFFQ